MKMRVNEPTPFGGVRVKEGLFLGDHNAAEVVLPGFGVSRRVQNYSHSELQWPGILQLLRPKGSKVPRLGLE